jgi:hypothetical protein
MRTKRAFPMSVLALVLLTFAWIALFRLQPGPQDHLAIGFLFDSLYGHSTLASGWIVFGPGDDGIVSFGALKGTTHWRFSRLDRAQSWGVSLS